MFSPEGRLHQVEYAIQAISQAGAAVGLVCSTGIVLAAEKRITSKLLDIRNQAEKMYSLDHHVACAVAGITSDANILINQARLIAQQYTYQYQEPIPIENLLQQICDLKQGYTQFGGLRPFGVSFLFIGYDVHYGYQMYQSDPSGNYAGWKARAIGANNQAAQSLLKSEYQETMTLDEIKLLAVKVLSKTMDTTSPTPDKLEFATLQIVDEKVQYKVMNKSDLSALLKRAETVLKAEAAKESSGSDI